MHKFWLNSLLFRPAILATMMVVAIPAIASAESAPTNSDSIGQLTSVSQLSDVKPSDWAFQSLQSLVERYGCIAGYPDKTFRGNRALTRYEFAAGLNACLDQINQLIAVGTTDLAKKEDLEAIKRLQEEYAEELLTIRGQVDALEARTATLESQQFSTTTKLRGEVIFGLASPFGSGTAVNSDVQRVANAANVKPSRPEIGDNFILADRVRLNFDTSFTGQDRLRVRLQARNITSFNAAVTGTNQTRLGFDGNESNGVNASVVSYRFPLSDATTVHVGAAGLEFVDEVPTLSRNFDSSGSGAVSRFGRYNPIYRSTDSGTGVLVNHKFNDALTLSAGYLVPDATATNSSANDPTAGKGLFNGNYSALGQLTYQATPQLSLAAAYSNSYYRDGSGITGSTGTGFANNPFNSAPTSANSYSLAANYRLNPSVQISAWGGFTKATAERRVDPGISSGSLTGGATAGNKAEIWNWAVQLGLPDFGGEGNFAGIVFGVPPHVASNDYSATFAGTPFRTTTVPSRRRDTDTSYHLEAFYKYKFSDNITITPGLITIFNPEGNSNNPATYVGVVRTTFSF
ncbi:MAG: iron uptake porin [Gloeotrichia echinulata DEX184]|nr:iron uptake porin [Gloeotrichia echinulata DEX184]